MSTPGSELVSDRSTPTTAPPVLFRADPLGRDLAPAARRAAEIDHAQAARQQVKALVELLQLERGARAVALLPRLGDIGVVELPRQPIG